MTPVEIIARGIALAIGDNPDAPTEFQTQVGVSANRPPAWRKYAQQAEAIWDELRKAGYAKD
jgi:hypothetical protein